MYNHLYIQMSTYNFNFIVVLYNIDLKLICLNLYKHEKYCKIFSLAMQ